MAIEFRCGTCQTLLRVDDEYAGREAKCPTCGSVMPVPAVSSPPASPAPPTSGSPFASDSSNPYSSPAAYEAPAARGPAPTTALVPTLISLEDVFSRAWGIFTQRPGFCVGTWLLLFVMNLGFQLIVSQASTLLAEQGNTWFFTHFIPFLGEVATNVFSLWLMAGQLFTFLQLARGQEVAVGDVFSGGPYLLRFLGAAILYVLIVLGGMILLIVPGIIFAIMFSQCFYLIVDRNMGIRESLDYSRVITSGNKATYFLIVLTCVGLFILAALPCLLGLFVLLPFTMVLFPVVYLAMTGQWTPEQVGFTPPAPSGL